MKKIAVFASGGGTDFQSVIDANEKENFCLISYLVASKSEIGAIERAEKHGIKTIVFDKTKETKDEFYARVGDGENLLVGKMYFFGIKFYISAVISCYLSYFNGVGVTTEI